MKLEEINFTQKKAKDFNILTRLYQIYAVHILVLPILRFLFYKVKMKKNKNLEKKLYVIAPNHISYLDVFLVNLIFGRNVAYMAKKELFRIDTWKHRYIAKNIYRLGAFSVNREKISLSTVKSAKEVFKANYSLCIFPQGGIRKNKTLENINEGFIYFAKRNKIDILPIGISGLEEYNWKPFKRKEVILQEGEVIPYTLPDEEIKKEWAKQICEITGYVNKI